MKRYNKLGRYAILKDTLIYVAEIDDVITLGEAGYHNPIPVYAERDIYFDFSKTAHAAAIEESPRYRKNEVYLGFYLEYNNKKVLLRLLLHEKDLIVL